MKDEGLGLRDAKIGEELLSQVRSHVVTAIAWYSASTKEHAIVV